MKPSLRRCKKPKNVKVGDVFYKAESYTDDETGKVSIDLDELHKTSARKPLILIRGGIAA